MRCSTSRTHDCSIIMNTKQHVDKTLAKGFFALFPYEKSATLPARSWSALPPHSSPWTPAPYGVPIVLEEEEESGFLLCPPLSVQIAYVCISHQRLSSSGQRESFRHWRSRRDQISVDVNTPNDVATNLALLTTPLLLFRCWLLVTSKLPVRVM